MRKVTSRRLLITGVFGASAVALGALGAHGLKEQFKAGAITAAQLSGYETAVLYHLTHALAMLAVVVFLMFDQHKTLRYAFLMFGMGIILFSGSLYLLAVRDLLGAPWLRFLGPVTPIGGILLIAGWILISLRGLRKVRQA